MYIPTLSPAMALILLRAVSKSVFRSILEQLVEIFAAKMSTDLKNLIQVSFPDSGVSVIVYAVIVFFPFLFLFSFSFLFLFLVDVGRSPSDYTGECNKRGVAAFSPKKSK